jgi:hypothetical protein
MRVLSCSFLFLDYAFSGNEHQIYALECLYAVHQKDALYMFTGMVIGVALWVFQDGLMTPFVRLFERFCTHFVIMTVHPFFDSAFHMPFACFYIILYVFI